MRGILALRLAWGPAVVASAFLATAFVGLLSFSLGVVIEEHVLLWIGWPVAGLMTGLGAALAATWMANLLAPDRSRTRLWTTLAWTEGAALAGLALFYVLLLRGGPGGPFAQQLSPFVALVTGVSALTALRARRPQHSLRRDAWISVGFLALLPVGWYGVIGIACALDACGA